MTLRENGEVYTIDDPAFVISIIFSVLFLFSGEEKSSHPPGDARVKGTRETESRTTNLFFLFGKVVKIAISDVFSLLAARQ